MLEMALGTGFVLRLRSRDPPSCHVAVKYTYYEMPWAVLAPI